MLLQFFFALVHKFIRIGLDLSSKVVRVLRAHLDVVVVHQFERYRLRVNIQGICPPVANGEKDSKNVLKGAAVLFNFLAVYAKSGREGFVGEGIAIDAVGAPGQSALGITLLPAYY